MLLYTLRKTSKVTDIICNKVILFFESPIPYYVLRNIEVEM